MTDMTADELRAALRGWDGTLVVRTARKQWVCTCSLPGRPNFRPDCTRNTP